MLPSPWHPALTPSSCPHTIILPSHHHPALALRAGRPQDSRRDAGATKSERVRAPAPT